MAMPLTDTGNISARLEYEPLDKSKREIRLVKFKAVAEKTDTIHMTLHRFNLEDANLPPYIPFSYCWGSPGEDFPGDWEDSGSIDIHIDGRILPVRRNLFLALLIARYAFPPGTYHWIDAICVNQKSNTERSHQVQLMDRIYRKCEKVFAWLGPEDEHSTRAFDMINEFAPQVQHGFNGDDWTVKSEPPRTDRDLPVKAQWWSLAQVCSRNLWRRIWVVQEFSISPDVWIYAGKRHVTLERLQHICNFSFQNWHKTQDWLLHTVSIVVASPVRSFQPAAWFKSDGLQSRPTPKYNILEALPRLRDLQASDPSDKVYAALSIANNDMYIRAKYEITAAELFTSIARVEIERTGSLDILRYCVLPTKIAGLPSWAPDWTVGTSRWDSWDLAHYVWSEPANKRAGSTMERMTEKLRRDDQPLGSIEIDGKRLRVLVHIIHAVSEIDVDWSSTQRSARARAEWDKQGTRACESELGPFESLTKTTGDYIQDLDQGINDEQDPEDTLSSNLQRNRLIPPWAVSAGEVDVYHFHKIFQKGDVLLWILGSPMIYLACPCPGYANHYRLLEQVTTFQVADDFKKFNFEESWII